MLDGNGSDAAFVGACPFATGRVDDERNIVVLEVVD